jgi:hypothetical protein
MGAGLAFAISEEKYLHTPVAFVFPSVYAGYQAYKNREHIGKFARTLATTNQIEYFYNLPHK